MLSSFELETIIKEIFSDNTRKNDYGYLSDMRVENLLAVSYKSRYFLELLQNARDTIVEGKVSRGKVRAWTEDGVFYFANNGAHFTADGVRSISYPAISTKSDPTMVGHKGIGFNAVREISVKPAIITTVGTVYFDVDEARVRLGRPDNNLPLFRYPMFNSETIRDIDLQLEAAGFTSLFKFPLKDGIDENRLKVSRPAAEDMIFLSAIKELEINETIIEIDDSGDPIVVKENSAERTFRKYRTIFGFSKDEINTFDPDERAQFSKSSEAEAVFLLETDTQGRFKKTSKAKLHLFYGLDLLTGFSFSLHSYFSVSIERKSLMEGSSLNSLLFGHISTFYTNDLINIVKRDFPGQELDILSFKRQQNNRMEELYNKIKIGLKSQKFIFHPQLKEYFSPVQLLIVTKEEYEVFRDGKLGDKFLYISDSYATFLREEMGIGLISDSFLKANVEQKAEQYKDDPKFFERLYGLIEQRKLYAGNKKVLLTEIGNLVAGTDTDLFYQPTHKYSGSAILEKDIAFLNSGIDIRNLRGGLDRYLNVKEFNGIVLTRRAIRLIEKQDSSTIEGQNFIVELLHVLIQLELTDTALIRNLKNVISFPVRNMKTGVASWARQYSRPIYFEDFKYATVYDDDFDAVDYNTLRIQMDKREKWKPLLSRLGVWEIPAVYLKTAFRGENPINEDLEVINDPILHLPCYFDKSFFEVIRDNWSDYTSFISDDRGALAMTIKGSASLSHRQKFECSALNVQLKSLNWIPALTKKAGDENKSEQFYMPSEVIAISPTEYAKTNNAVLYQFIPVAVIDENLHSSFCEDLDILHFQRNSRENFGRILNFLEQLYPDPEKITNKKGMKNLSNRILSFLYEFLTRYDNDININMQYFREQKFLAEGIEVQKLVWLEGKYCLHIDDKSFLDILSKNQFLVHLSNPFAFTKKDKKEWGRFGSKIGRPVRKMVTMKLNSEGIEQNLLRYFLYPDVILGFIEEDLSQNFTDEELLGFKEVSLTIHDSLKVIYSFEGHDKEVIQPFYVSDDKIPMLHIGRKVFEDRHLKALAITEWLEKYEGKELVRFHLVVEQVFGTDGRGSAINYAITQNLDEVRLQYIFDVLSLDYFTKEDFVVKSDPIVFPAASPNSPPIKSRVVTVNESRPVIQLDMEQGLKQYFDLLDQRVMTPSEALIPRNISAVSADLSATDPMQVNSVVPSYRSEGAELADRDKVKIGFFAELYIYKKLMVSEPTLLKLINLDETEAKCFQWLNFHRLDNLDLPDGSRGYGYDFCHPTLDIAIEVKGMLNDSGLITITGKEFDSMRERDDRYFLVIVKNILPEIFNVVVIRNPYEKILSGELFFLESKIRL